MNSLNKIWTNATKKVAEVNEYLNIKTTTAYCSIFCALPVSAQDLNDSVESGNTFVGNLYTFGVAVFGLGGMFVCGTGIAKATGILEMKPGENKGAQLAKIIGGGALAGITVLVHRSRDTFLAS